MPSGHEAGRSSHIEPRLHTAEEAFDATAEPILEELDSYLELAGAIADYRSRKLLGAEGYDRSTVNIEVKNQLLCREWGRLGTSFPKGEPQLPQPGQIYPYSRLSVSILDRIQDQPTASFPVSQLAVLQTAAIHPPNAPRPLVALETIRTILQPYRELVGIMQTADNPGVTNQEFRQQLIAALHTLPGRETVDTFAGFAYLDIITTLGKHVIRPYLNASKEQTITADQILAINTIIYQSARMLDAAAVTARATQRRMLVDVKNDLNDEINKVFRTLGVMVDAFNLTVIRGRIFEAHLVMAELYKVKYLQNTALNWLENDDGDGLQSLQEEIAGLTTQLSDANEVLLADLEERLAIYDDQSPVNEQAYVIEAAKVTRLREVAEKMRAAGILSSSIERAFDELTMPQLQSRRDIAKVTANQDRVAKLLEELGKLEQPYLYTRKTIRSFENGPGLVRDLKDELGRRKLLEDEDVIQSLAILIGQAEKAEDKAAYFDQLAERRKAIESLLSKLTAIDANEAERAATTIQALDWVDEMIEAATATDGRLHIDNERLKQFIVDYFSPPEPAPAKVSGAGGSEKTALAKAKRPRLTPEQLAERQRAYQVYRSEIARFLRPGEKLRQLAVQPLPPAAGSHANTLNGKRRSPQREIDSDRLANMTDFDPARIRHMFKLRNKLRKSGLHAEITDTLVPAWCPLPPLVLVVKKTADAKEGVCIIEPLFNKMGTYGGLIDSDLFKAPEDIVGLNRPDIIALGGVSYVHPPRGSSTFYRHYSDKLEPYIQEELQVAS